MSLKAYQTTDIETAVLGASPLGLLVLTYDRLLDSLAKTKAKLESGADAQEPSEKAIDLIQLGLVSALDMEKGGEISKSLFDLYQWAVKEILRARLHKDPEIVLGVIRVIDDLASAWRELLERQSRGESFMSSASVQLSTQATQAFATP
jgi:flagellar secretion chaperone FliS